MSKRGIDCKVYRNTGSWNAPTWSECDLISDAAPKEGWDVFDVHLRRTRAKMGVKTLIDIGFTGTMFNDPDDANYAAFVAALHSDDTLDLLILDGANDVNGSSGVRGEYQVTSGDQNQNAEVALFRSINLVPYPSANIPQFADVVGGSVVFTDITTAGMAA